MTTTPTTPTGPQVGEVLAPVTLTPTEVALFRFSAVTWNPHRIHYDRPYAATEGYPGVLVQAHLHGCWLYGYAAAWARERGLRVARFGYRNQAPAVPGDVLTLTGVVTGLGTGNGAETVPAGEVRLDAVETNADGIVCASAQIVLLPDAAVPHQTEQEDPR